MTVLITGGTGMLGRTFARRLRGERVAALGSRDLDIGDAAACVAAVAAHKSRVVIHCAAMTAVDRCETDHEIAYRTNTIGCANIAAACSRQGARLVAISTDYVFAGDLDRPYHEWDAANPRTIYGASKRLGEELIRQHCADHLIARVSWLYGPGGPSFVHTMLRLGTQTGGPVKVVRDQIGNPTSTDAVADALVPLLNSSIVGTLHLTCEGDTSWSGLATAVFAQINSSRPIEPCTTAEVPRPAPRPANSRLDKLGLRLHRLPAMITWQEALSRFLREFPDG